MMTLGPEVYAISWHIAGAWVAGAAIGLERTFHGRPAGFRTHAIVCLSSALLMAVTSYQWDWLGQVPLETIRTDPTRMAQGIMMGIGFLGAGVIFKDGMTVRGLTTAASIWTTAAIGILFGVGFSGPASIATIVTLGTLGLFRWIEARIPAQIHAQLIVRFRAEKAPGEDELRAMLSQRGFSVANMSYRLDEGGSIYEYRMTLRTLSLDDLAQLAILWRGNENVVEFRLSQNSD